MSSNSSTWYCFVQAVNSSMSQKFSQFNSIHIAMIPYSRLHLQENFHLWWFLIQCNHFHPSICQSFIWWTLFFPQNLT
jgi:hypothetical protein